MAFEKMDKGRLSAMMLRGRSTVRVAGLGALALAMLMVATATFQSGTANAAARMASGFDALETCGVAGDFSVVARVPGLWDVGADAMSASWPAIPAYAHNQGWESGGPMAEATMVEVWSATMTVGMASNETTTYMGYIPGVASGTEGSLDEAAFNRDGTEYTVQGIFHQQEIGGFQQLVFTADESLPADLVFRTGTAEFPVSDSLTLGLRKNIHAWPLDASPGWEEHQNIAVSLMEPSDPGPPPRPICG